MIANARMYSVTPQVAALWRALLASVLEGAGDPVEIVDHAPPAPISELWKRPDKAAVFMCGLPYSLATPQPTLVVAPVPSPVAYGDRACYWSDVVVRADSPFQSLEQTFGHRLALTTPESQSGYAALLYTLMPFGSAKPLYRTIIEPRFTPMGALTAVIEKKAEVAPLDSYVTGEGGQKYRADGGPGPCGVWTFARPRGGLSGRGRQARLPRADGPAPARPLCPPRAQAV
jgi:ABC-type phosphate/phosphonate transport system substrate-binding protein